MLEDRSFNITKYLSHIIKAFEDFRLVQNLREEIEKLQLDKDRTCLKNGSKITPRESI